MKSKITLMILSVFVIFIATNVYAGSRIKCSVCVTVEECNWFGFQCRDREVCSEVPCEDVLPPDSEEI